MQPDTEPTPQHFVVAAALRRLMESEGIPALQKGNRGTVNRARRLKDMTCKTKTKALTA